MSLRTFPRFLMSAFFAATVFASVPHAIAAPSSYTLTSTDGVKLAVQESGDPNGRPIILVHGLLGSRLNWDAQVQSAELRQYRIITYDMRGHGLSDKPSGAEPYHDGNRWGTTLQR